METSRKETTGLNRNQTLIGRIRQKSDPNGYTSYYSKEISFNPEGRGQQLKNSAKRVI